MTETIAGPTTDFGLTLEPVTNYYFVIWTEDPDVCGDAELFVEGIYQGCTDPVALNYDPQANEEDYLHFGDNVPAMTSVKGPLPWFATAPSSVQQATLLPLERLTHVKLLLTSVWYMFEVTAFATLDLRICS